ncbi:MAG: hypothetical protein M1825_002099 [Sarcosagium campestre]|nr:MAG: hypothetical protein M1825_002099 [Sarcosagium campestre]
MVLFKRKPVQYLPNPQIEDDNTDVWVIGQTGEIFTLYEAYLQRMDFYKQVSILTSKLVAACNLTCAFVQRRFICDITGHSGLDFFEALKSEIHGAKDVDRSFPEPLREPVLRKVQFSTISRIDSLVDWIFDEFKQDFYPGETVTVLVASGQRLNGIVREKTRFTEIRGVDGFVERRGFSRYFVALINRPEEEALVDDDHIMRDRKAFTKQILRSYIKNTVTRESWTGAPWLVKDHIAKKFRIETEVPSHLRQESKIAEKKAQLAQKRGEQNTKSLAAVSPNARLTDLKPSSKSHKSKQQQQVSKSKNAQSKDLQNGNTNGKKGTHSAEQVQFIHTNFPASDSTAARDPVKPPQPPPIKYPIEDLDIPIEFDPALSRRRPPLKFIAPVEPGPVPSKGPTNAHEFSAEAVGLLLETWDTLNVYCEVFVLDSFTFDDFVDALKVSSDDVECELFIEMHCAVLKILVDDESAGGKIQVMLPAMPEEEYSEEEDSVQDSTAPPSPTPEPEPVVRASRRTTRSSLAAAEADKAANRSRSGSRETATHRAVEMLADYSWADRLRKRDFKLGGWETIMVGLLYQLSLKKQNESACETILRELAPIDMEATQETARYQYANLNCNLRIKALQMICMLTMETKVVRAYLEECGEESTGIRRERVELQRKRKML